MSTLLQDHARIGAERDGGADALVLGEERVSYAQLEAESNRLARLLRDLGVGRGDRVALMVPKGPVAVVAMHAVLKAGAAYVPVDLSSPAPRVALVLASAEPRVILAAAAAGPLLEALTGDGDGSQARVVSVDAGWRGSERVRAVHGPGGWAALSAEPADVRVDPGDLAHVLFTSGSTGVPKGVQITHAMAGAFVEWAVAHFDIGARRGERNSSHPPLHFDLSTFDVYGTLRGGAELHFVPPTANLLPRTLAAFIRDSELTQWFSVPSTLAFMARADVIGDDDFPALERVLFCGEPMPTPVLAHWMRKVPHARYTNLYGPTETTIASSFYDVPEVPRDETESLPIGVACPGEDLVILDEQLQPAPAGELGEIAIAGVGLSPGYWRDEEKTRGAFIADPRNPRERLYRTGDLGWIGEDGLARCAGRLDSQIKHRGYRIELGEIEASLNTVPGLGECAVVAIDSGGFEGTTICCAYATGTQQRPATVRAALARTLPAYMLPTRWLVLDSLPKNQNGKIDRRGLREMFETENEAGVPSETPA